MPIQHLQSGSRMCQVVIRCGTVYLADIGRFDGMDRVGNAWVSPGYTPARATVRCAPDRPGNLAGIMVVARWAHETPGCRRRARLSALPFRGPDLRARFGRASGSSLKRREQLLVNAAEAAVAHHEYVVSCA